jgi:hypothetical protein
MDRAELERLDRSTLITRAEALGISRANILTRPELMDELLVRTARKDDRDLPRARGFFGRARDLVARVIEKGLHLPDAAERLRQVSVTASQLAARALPTVVPTVTLAEIYAAQGHRSRAIDTLRRVLEIEPEHGAAQSLLTKLETAPLTVPPRAPPPAEDESDDVVAPRDAAAAVAYSAPPRAPEVTTAPTTMTEHGEPRGFLDDEPLPERYDVDECVAIAVDPETLYVYWEVRSSTLEHVRLTRPDGGLTLRLLIVTPSWDGPGSATRDFDVDATMTHRTVRDLPRGAVVRAGIGWRTGEVFLPIAHAPALETPPGLPCPALAESFVRWTPRGIAPVTAKDADYASIGRALGTLNPQGDRGPAYGRTSSPQGSSDVSAGFGGSKVSRPSSVPSSEAMI